MTDKKVKELANEILQAYFFDYVDVVDVAKAVEIIRKYIPKDTVLVNLDQYRKWQDVFDWWLYGEKINKPIEGQMVMEDLEET